MCVCVCEREIEAYAERETVCDDVAVCVRA